MPRTVLSIKTSLTLLKRIDAVLKLVTPIVTFVLIALPKVLKFAPRLHTPLHLKFPGWDGSGDDPGRRTASLWHKHMSTLTGTRPEVIIGVVYLGRGRVLVAGLPPRILNLRSVVGVSSTTVAHASMVCHGSGRLRRRLEADVREAAVSAGGVTATATASPVEVCPEWVAACARVLVVHDGSALWQGTAPWGIGISDG